MAALRPLQFRCLNRLSNILKYKQYSTTPDEPNFESQKTRVQVMNRGPGDKLLIQQVTNEGFLLTNDVMTYGSIAMFPNTVLSWKIRKVEDITPSSLSLVTILQPRIDLLVIGTGIRGSNIHPNIIKYLRSKKIPFEIMPTEKAVSVFNIVNADHRFVAGFFIQASDTSISIEESIEAKLIAKNLVKIESD